MYKMKPYESRKTEKYMGFGVFYNGVEVFTLPVGYDKLCEKFAEMLNKAFNDGYSYKDNT